MLGFLVNDHLPRLSHKSANGKGDYEVKPETVHRSRDIYHDRLIKAL